MAAAAPSPWQPRLRVLCLHGRCQTSEVFQLRLERLVSKAARFAEFAFVDGPCELPLQHGEKENTRGWSQGGASVDSPEVREVLRVAWAQRGPFDAVLGFSEGASAALLYCRLAAAASDEAPTFQGLRCALLAGGPAPAEDGAPLALPSLHCFSDSDRMVPAADSRKLAKAFVDAQLCKHSGGHGVPQRVEEMRVLIDFLQKMRETVYPEQASPCPRSPAEGAFVEDPRVDQEQQDEIEVLLAVYPELVRLTPQWPVRLALPLPELEGAQLRFTMPPAYPQETSVRLEFYADEVHVAAFEAEIVGAAEAAREPLGVITITSMAQAAEQFVAEADLANAAKSGGLAALGGSAAAASDGSGNEEAKWWQKEEDDLDAEALAAATRRAEELLPNAATTGSWAREAGAGSYGRPWEFVVGLVGKPSVGKSTLFNALTRPTEAAREAEMDPRPFTTIDPNVGPGVFAAPCPAASLGRGADVRPEHGSAPGNRRLHPLLVKDVAGLVPGAYLGRGRGNAFLQDLCDADALVHVVDGSGLSDREGVFLGDAAPAGDPVDEIGWVRKEMHLWIFTNVRGKWDTVRRRCKLPNAHDAQRAVTDRLFSLFCGYRATNHMAQAVYKAAGFGLPNIVETVLNFTESDLHLLVACFLRVRFPIVVALNKIDVPGAADRVAATLAKLGDGCVPVAARAEWWLFDHHRQGHLTYVPGGGAETVHFAASASPHLLEEWRRLREQVFDRYGSTGALDVVSQAVLRRRPVFACPVTDFESLQGLGARAAAPVGPLGCLVMLRPNSSVEEAFSALRHEGLLRGDFVRAELLERLEAGAAPAHRVLPKEEALSGGEGTALVLRVLTNKKMPGR